MVCLLVFRRRRSRTSNLKNLFQNLFERKTKEWKGIRVERKTQQTGLGIGLSRNWRTERRDARWARISLFSVIWKKKGWKKSGEKGKTEKKVIVRFFSNQICLFPTETKRIVIFVNPFLWKKFMKWEFVISIHHIKCCCSNDDMSV